jgi:hypothetical protein
VSWLVPVTPDVLRRKTVIAREWQRVDPKFLDVDEQEFWARSQAVSCASTSARRSSRS